MTLIEVVAAIALLGTLLVSIMLAYGRHARQVRLAQRRLDAVAVADQLLTEWHQTGSTAVAGSRGHIQRSSPFVWMVRHVDAVSDLGVEIRRLEIHQADTTKHEKPLAVVDFLVPMPEPESSDDVSDEAT